MFQKIYGVTKVKLREKWPGRAGRLEKKTHKFSRKSKRY